MNAVWLSRTVNSARHYLTHINYYRLRAYWLPFETEPANGDDHAFVADTNFETILAIYVFDRDLRLLLLDAIERIEISLRTTLAQHLATAYGPFAHDDGTHFKDRSSWEKARMSCAKSTSAAEKPLPNTTGNATRNWSHPPSGSPAS